MGISPLLREAIFCSCLSTHTTWCPKSEKHAPDTSPTYPAPIIASCIIVLPKRAAPRRAHAVHVERHFYGHKESVCWQRPKRIGSETVPNLSAVSFDGLIVLWSSHFVKHFI